MRSVLASTLYREGVGIVRLATVRYGARFIHEITRIGVRGIKDLECIPPDQILEPHIAVIPQEVAQCGVKGVHFAARSGMFKPVTVDKVCGDAECDLVSGGRPLSVVRGR